MSSTARKKAQPNQQTSRRSTQKLFSETNLKLRESAYDHCDEKCVQTNQGVTPPDSPIPYLQPPDIQKCSGLMGIDSISPK